MMNESPHLIQRAAVGAGFALLTTSVTLGQTAINSTQRYVSPVDEGVSDISPLSASLIHNPADLRAVQQFDLVYPVPGRPDMLMRQSGALSAVFPFSDYTVTEDDNGDPRVSILIPAGTVFYIGPISSNNVQSFYSPVNPPRSVGSVVSANMRVTQPVSQLAGAGPLSIPQATRANIPEASRPPRTTAQDERARPSISVVTISDERYRRYRLGIIARELASAKQ